MPLGVALALPRESDQEKKPCTFLDQSSFLSGPSSHVVNVLNIITRGADLLEHVRQLPQKVESGQQCSCSNSTSQDIETGMRSISSTESSSVEDLASFGGSCSDESISSPLAANPNNNPSSSPSPSASPPPASSTYQPSCHRCRSLLGRRLILSLCEIHACILEVDEALIDENLPSELLDTASIR